MTTSPQALATRARSRSISPGVALAAIVAIGALARLVLAVQRTVPRYLPDEYLYGQLARSLGEGHTVGVLGRPTAFTALVEPLVLAPLWSGRSPATAVLLTQVLHVTVMALAAVPVYHLAHRLQLSTRAALLAAALTVAAPGLFFASLVTADALGYLLALLAVLAAVRSLTTPTVSGQLLFLGAALAATGTRLQYAVLIPLYPLAAVAVERRLAPAVRRHAMVLLANGAGALVVLAGPVVLGRYRTVTSFRVSADALHWLASGSFLLCLASGVVLVPTLLVWATSTLVARGSSRERTAFAAMALGTTVAILGMASVLTVETVSDRFLERYLIVVAPLAGLCFAAWLAEARPHARIVAAVALLLALVAARMPLSEFTGGQGVADSPTLMAVKRLEDAAGTANASFVAAAVVTLACVALLAVALRPRASAAIVVVAVAATVGVTSVGAQVWDRGASSAVEHGLFTRSPTWVDDHGTRSALLVQTPESLRFDAMITALMNRAITRAAPLGDQLIDTFDGLAPRALVVARDGRLLDGGRPVRSPVVWALGGTAAAFDDTRSVVYDERFVLAVPRDGVRLAMTATGIRHDGKVSPRGSIHVYPRADGGCTRMTVRLLVPHGFPPTTLRIDAGDRVSTVRVAATHPTRVAVTSTRSAARELRFRAVRLGDRVPGPGDGTVANARYTVGPVPCTGSQGT